MVGEVDVADEIKSVWLWMVFALHYTYNNNNIIKTIIRACDTRWSRLHCWSRCSYLSWDSCLFLILHCSWEPCSFTFIMSLYSVVWMYNYNWLIKTSEQNIQLIVLHQFFLCLLDYKIQDKLFFSIRWTARAPMAYVLIRTQEEVGGKWKMTRMMNE